MMTVQIANRTCEVVASDPVTAAFWQRVGAANWEEDTFRFVDRAAFLRHHPITLVDIGAAIGAVSLYASARVDEVLAIEPEPHAFAQLTANARANVSNIKTWNVAIDAKPGTLAVFPTNGGPPREGLEGVIARTITFADIDEAIDPARSVVIKIDIEGHEYRVLDALLAFAARRRAPIHLSLHPRSFASRWRAFRETRDALEKMQEIGTVRQSSTGAPMTLAHLFRLIFLKKRPKNFAVTVWPTD